MIALWGVRGARWLAGEKTSRCSAGVCLRKEAREAEQKDVCVVQDFGGQQCLCCAARDKNVVEGVD